MSAEASEKHRVYVNKVKNNPVIQRPLLKNNCFPEFRCQLFDSLFYDKEMKILLINPNRFKSPPVPPLGLEYIAGSLENGGHEVSILDLCFSDDVFRELEEAVRNFRPELTGITVRNVDSVLYPDNEFYLDDIKRIVEQVKSYGLKVLLGGTGISTNPAGVLGYLNADYAFVGPAEEGILDSMDKINNSVPAERIFFGTCKPGLSRKRASSQIDYERYYSNGGIAGFETHKGCSSSCGYCLEANSRVVFRNTEEVLNEIKVLHDRGFDHFHLADSEFNEDLDFSIDFCSALKSSGLKIRWAVYMKPGNFNRKIFRLMKETGVYLITLTVDSFRKCSQYWSDVERAVFLAKSNGIRLTVDFLSGFPHEDESVMVECLDLFRRVQPDAVNINTFIRLYKTLQITDLILKDKSLQGNIHGAVDDPAMLHPVFYNHVKTDRLKELIRGDAIFKIAGEVKGVNYQEGNREGSL
jgi:hypothetical protein